MALVTDAWRVHISPAVVEKKKCARQIPIGTVTF